MEMESPQHQQQFDWAHDAFLALNDPNMASSPDKWPMMAQGSPFAIHPSLLSQASVERYGQVTPPDDLSPAAEPLRPARDGSIPVELRNEEPWAQQHNNKDEPQNQPDESAQNSPPASASLPKRRRTTRTQAPANQASAAATVTPQQPTPNNPQPPKRKRGRPKSQPQMVEAFTADGFPFQVSSARQSHLEKNRVAAHKCRQRKKEYINGLEGRCREFSSKNKALKENVAMLREEVLGLKNEVLRHAGCGFWAVDEYLARCAGDLLGMEVPLLSPSSRDNFPLAASDTEMPVDMDMKMDMKSGTDSSDAASGTSGSPAADDPFDGLELLQAFDDEDMRDM